MEEVRFHSVETRNEAGEVLRYPCFTQEWYASWVRAAAAYWRCSCGAFKERLVPDVSVVHSCIMRVE